MSTTKNTETKATESATKPATTTQSKAPAPDGKSELPRSNQDFPGTDSGGGSGPS